MVLAKRTPQWARAFVTALEVVNTKYGHVVTMHDEGTDAHGNPVKGREALIAKLGVFDEDGDPVFVFGEHGPMNDGVPTYVFKGWPAHVVKNDETARVRIQAIARTVNDPSRNPKYKTLGEKAAANRLAHEAEEARQREAREQGRQAKIVLPPEIAGIFKMLSEKDAAAAEKRATRTVASLKAGL